MPSVSVTNLETLLQECSDAVSTKDWAAAASKWAQARIVAAGLPMTSADGMTVNYGEILKDLKDALEYARAMEAAESADAERRLISTHFGRNPRRSPRVQRGTA